MLLKPAAINLRQANAADADAIKLLLAANGLPTDDLHDAMLANFLVAIDDNGIIGVIGAEVFGENALLRSLCTRKELRQQGVGRALTMALIQKLTDQGVRHVFLLTESAENFFARHGFSRVERADVPAEIAETEQFGNLCPASAVCMQRELK